MTILVRHSEFANVSIVKTECIKLCADASATVVSSSKTVVLQNILHPIVAPPPPSSIIVESVGVPFVKPVCTSFVHHGVQIQGSLTSSNEIGGLVAQKIPQIVADSSFDAVGTKCHALASGATYPVGYADGGVTSVSHAGGFPLGNLSNHFSGDQFHLPGGSKFGGAAGNIAADNLWHSGDTWMGTNGTYNNGTINNQVYFGNSQNGINTDQLHNSGTFGDLQYGDVNNISYQNGFAGSWQPGTNTNDLSNSFPQDYSVNNGFNGSNGINNDQSNGFNNFNSNTGSNIFPDASNDGSFNNSQQMNFNENLLNIDNISAVANPIAKANISNQQLLGIDSL